MNQVGFWSRVGHWFKGSGQPAAPTTDTRSTTSEGLASTGGDRESTGDVETVLGPGAGKLDTKLRFSRSGPNLERLTEEYGRVVKLMDAIHNHMSVQDERTERMVRTLEELTQSTKHGPETSRQQLELLASIRDATATQAAGTHRLEEELSQLPKVADAQRETMVAIGRQLDTAKESTERVARVMGGVEKTVGTIGEVSESSVKTLERIQSDLSSREDRLVAQLEHQGRRLSLLAWTAVGLAGAMAVMGLIALLR
ncbi:MAG: hypothetical protein ACE5EX_04260 [Phycisphaerae bacterium]